MSRFLFLFAAALIAATASAQHSKFLTALKNGHSQRVTSQKSFYKSAALFKPALAMDYYNYDSITNEYADTFRIRFSYYPDGKVKQKIYEFNDETPYSRKDLEYDRNGMESKSSTYFWSGSDWVFFSEVGTAPQFDGQGRLSSFIQYQLDENKDTTDYKYPASVKYYNDSTVMSYYDETTNAPGKVVEHYVFYKEGGSSTYVSINIFYWDEDASAYDVERFRNADYNGNFKIENVAFFPDELRVFFKYVEMSSTSEGVTYEARVKGTITPAKETEVFEEKIGIVYQPTDKTTYSLDSKQNLILTESEYDYNAISMDYDSYYNSKHDFTYQGENMTSDLYSTSNNNNVNYWKRELFTYSDFADINGISAVSPLQNLNVFPNPASTEFTFVVNDKVNEVFAVDMSGRKLKLDHQPVNEKLKVSVSVLESGIYTLIVRTEEKIFQTLITVIK